MRLIRLKGLLFHPDILNRTQLGRNMQRYEFFSYSSTEALHLSETEVNVFKQVLNHSVVKQFNLLLKDYIRNQSEKEGLPNVGYFADKCCLTAGYFGQLVKTNSIL